MRVGALVLRFCRDFSVAFDFIGSQLRSALESRGAKRQAPTGGGAAGEEWRRPAATARRQ
jgi:hypothetical protein